MASIEMEPSTSKDVALTILTTEGFEETAAFETANLVAQSLLEGVNRPDVLDAITLANSPGTSSQQVQRAILPVAHDLGFESEKKGLFSNYAVSALRPDYYLGLGETGILFEVERGKTLINNMDLLDMWKCHICPEATVLFLFVPRLLRQNDIERGTRVYGAVVNRLSTFFTPDNRTNVHAAFVFGY